MLSKMKEKARIHFKKVKMYSVSLPIVAGTFGNSKLATGTLALIDDVTSWLLILAPVLGGLLLICFFLARGSASEQDQQKWNNKIKWVIVCTVGAVLASSIIQIAVSYYK